jgi:cytochrome c-type biogenesis protein CcmH/NrfF
VREQLARGDSTEVIAANYVAEYGSAALAVPANKGALRLIYAVPIAASIGGLGVVFVVVRRWKRRGDAAAPAKSSHPSTDRDEYDAKLDEELKKLDA